MLQKTRLSGARRRNSIVFSRVLTVAPVVMLVLISLVVLKYFFGPGLFQTHDGQHHLIRLSHLTRELAHGQFPVRLAQDMMNGFGYPVFNYTYPLPYYFASIFVFSGWDLTTSLNLTIITSTTLSIIAMYFWLRRYFDRKPSFVGAIAYLLVPYHLLSLYVSGQLGTIMAFLFLPLALLSIKIGISTQRNLLGILCIALSLSGLLLSHILSAFIALPLLVVYGLYVLKAASSQRMKAAQMMLVSCVLALLLSAFYWVPVVTESAFVRMGHQPTVQATDHFVTLRQLLYSPWGYGYSSAGTSDGMSFQMGLAHWLVLFVALAVIGLNWKKKKLFWLALTMLGITVFGMTMSLDWSMLLWNHMPLLSKTQYPWRWLLLPAVSLSWLTAWLVSQFATKISRNLVVIMLLISFAFASRNYLRPMEVKFYDDQTILTNTDYYGSTEISLESLPIAVRKLPKNPSTEIRARQAEGIFPQQSLRPGKKVHQISNEIAGLTQLEVFYFPMWKVYKDGKEIESFAGDNGLLSVYLPPGQHSLVLDLEKTDVQKIAEITSLISLISVLSILIFISFQMGKTRKNLILN